MRRDNDFQLYERIAYNVQQKRRSIRWGLLAINGFCFLLFSLFLMVAANESVQEFYLISPFRWLLRSGAGHVLWIPMLLWLFTLMNHFGSVVIESGSFDKLLTAVARDEEEEIIEALVEQVADVEKRKRETSHLEMHSEEIRESEDPVALRAAEHQRDLKR